MKIAIIGSRTFEDYDMLKSVIIRNLYIKDIDVVISGGANGADKLGERFALEFDKELIVHKADWKKYGRSAGPIRNKYIINDADFIFVFWDGKSKGTKNSIELVKTLNKEVLITLIE